VTSDEALVIAAARDLDTEACREVVDGRRIEVSSALLAEIDASRRRMLGALESSGPVYGVSTGMGAASGIRLTTDEQEQQQANLMIARSVGSAPYLRPRETRGVMVARLATLLNGDAGVSAGLCTALVAMLNDGVVPAIPAGRAGSAGEIIPLAHLGASASGVGQYLDDAGAVTATPPDGFAPHVLGQKEGVAFIEGVPVATGLAIEVVGDARILLTRFVDVTAAGLHLFPLSRDPFDPRTARSDDDLSSVDRAILDAAGPPPPSGERALQAPVSFRVGGHALAHARRATRALDAAAERALRGVTDSPAFLEGDFVGTAGFDGFDLAASGDALRVALVHLAEISAARLHRLLDPGVTGLPRQLSASPGLHAGMVTVHKRAAGVVHSLVRLSAPASLGVIETSLGQEDVQSFAVESLQALRQALDAVRDVLACELLALLQARRLQRRDEESHVSGGSPAGRLLDRLDRAVAPGVRDRPFGRDVDTIRGLLERSGVDQVRASTAGSGAAADDVAGYS
jgi:histidine ammonia-lyase